jgi:hypothetical protein
MAAIHHPKPDTLAFSNVDPAYLRIARQVAAEQGLKIGEYATKKFLEGLRNDLVAQEMSLPEPAEPCLPDTLMQ